MTSLAIVVMLAANARADVPRASIDLEVTGPVDANLLARSIASELSHLVMSIAATAACRVPCLSIAVTGSAATVTFTPTDGTTRRRTIELGSDRAQWTTTLALLAGNVVRDEAAGLLADPLDDGPISLPEQLDYLPPPRLAPVAPAAPAIIVAPRRISPIGIGLVPGLSTDLFDLRRAHVISIGIVAGASGYTEGLALSGAVDVARGVAGAQIAGAVAVAGELSGAQVAGVVAVADRSTGSQVAGAVVVARRADVQVGGAVTAADVTKTQVAGAVAVAKRSTLQIAGAVSASDFARTQIAGAIAVAERSDVQIAGAVNVSGHSSGLQLAPINIARRNDGVQVGVLNIGGGRDGDAYGLINIVPGGRTDIEASVDADRIGAIMLRHGSRHWHNVYAIAGQPVSTPSGMPSKDVWMYGLGIGPSFHIAGLPTDVDVIAWEVNHGDHHERQLSLLNQLRVTIGVPLGRVTLVAGGVLDVYVSNDHSSPFLTSARSLTPPDPMDTSVTVKVWPSVFVGVRLK